MKRSRVRFGWIWTILALMTPILAAAQGPSVRITEGAKNNDAQFIGTAAIDYPMLQVAVQNQSTETIQIRTVTVAAEGSADDVADIAANGVRLVRDLNGDGEASTDTNTERILGQGVYNQDNGTITFDFTSLPVDVLAGATINLLVVYNMNGTALDGETLRVYLDAETDITTIGLTSGEVPVYQANAFPVNGISHAIGQGTLSVTALADSVSDDIRPYFLAGATRNEGIRLEFKNTGDERIALHQVIVSATGTLNDATAISVDGVELVPLTLIDSPMPGQSTLPFATGSISGNNGTVVLNIEPPLAFRRNETKYIAVAINNEVVESEYFKQGRYSVEDGSVQVEGLDSLSPQITVLGEGLAGPTRAYHGHGNTLALVADAGVEDVRPGTTDYVTMSFSIKNDVYEGVHLDGMTFKALGSANETTALGQIRLWQEVTQNGAVDPPGAGGNPDIELGAPQAFTLDNGTVTFNFDEIAFIANQTRRFVLAVDVLDSAPENATLQFQIATATAITGSGDATTAPPVSLNAPLNGSIRTIKTPKDLPPPTYALSDLDATRDAFERKAMPRTGQDILLWNFSIKPSDSQNMILDRLEVKLDQDVLDTDYVEKVALWWDKDNNGRVLPSNPTADVLLAEVPVAANDPLLVFNLVPISTDPVLQRNRETFFYLLADLKNAPNTVLGDHIRTSVTAASNIVLVGDDDGQIGTPTTAMPFASATKTIMTPQVTMTLGPVINGTQQVMTCINGGAEVMQFKLANGPSETMTWKQVDVTGSSSHGNQGLLDWVDQVYLYTDTDSDGKIEVNDLLLSLTSNPAFIGNQSILDVDGDLAILLPLFSDSEKDRVELPWNKTGTYLAGYSLNSPVFVPVDGSVFFNGVIPQAGVQLVGKDSGDPVTLLGDVANPGRQLTISNGDALVQHTSESIQNSDRLVPPGSRQVPAMTYRILTDILDEVAFDKLVLHIDKSNPDTPLTEIIDGPAAISIKRTLDVDPVAFGTIDFENATVTFDPSSFPNEEDNWLYSHSNPIIDKFTILIDVKTSAPNGEWIQLRLDEQADIKFSGICSLTPADQFVHSFLPEPPHLGRKITFGTSTLTFSLTNANDDFPDVAFPGNVTNPYPVVRFNMTADTNVEDIRVQGLRFDTIGTAHDVNALAASNGVLLYMNNTSVGQGVFNANDGSVTFSGMNLLVDGTEKCELRFMPSALTQTFTNIGQYFNLSIEPGAVVAIGDISRTTITKFVAKDQQDQTLPTDLPFNPPPVRIGAGRIFVNTTLLTNFPTQHIQSAVNIVTVPLTLKPDRAESQAIEEVVVRATGTLNELTALSGAAVRLHINANPTNTFTSVDTQLGVATFNANDGTARIRITPPRTIPANTTTNFFLAVDLNGTALDQQTFKHIIEGGAGVLAKGNLSNDHSTPWYDAANTFTPNAGFIEGPLHKVGRATVGLKLTTRIPITNPTTPLYVLPNTANVRMLSVQLDPQPIEDMQITSMTFKNFGNSDESTSVATARLYRDINKDGFVQASDVLLGSGTIATNDGPLTIAFGTPYNLTQTALEEWLLIYDMGAGVIGQSVQAGFDLPEDNTIPVDGVFGGFGLFSNRPIGAVRTTAGSTALVGSYAQFSPGILEARKGSQSPASRDLPLDVDNAVLLQFRLEEKAALENVTLTSLALVPTTTTGMNFTEAFGGAVFSLYREDPATTNGVIDGAEPLVVTGAFNPATTRVEFDLSAANESVSKSSLKTYLVAVDLAAPASQDAKSFVLTFNNVNLFAGVGQTSALATQFKLPGGNITSGTFKLANSTVKLTRDNTNTPGSTTGFASDSTNFVMLAFDAKASNASSLTFNSMLLEGYGSINESTAFTAGGVRLYRDGGSTIGALDGTDVLLDSTDFPADNGTISFDTFASPVTIAANATMDFIVVGTLNGTPASGSTVAVRIPNVAGSAVFISNVTGTTAAFDSTTVLPISGGPSPINPRELTASYYNGEIDDFGSLPAGTDLVVGRFELKASNAEALKVNSFNLGASGTMNDVTGITQLRVVQDADSDGVIDASDPQVAAGVYAANDGVFVVTPATTLTIPKNGSRKFLVEYDLSGSGGLGQNFRCTLQSASITGAAGSTAVTVIGLPLPGPLVTLERGTVKFAAVGAETANSIESSTRQNLVMQTFIVEVGGPENVVLTDFAFTLLDTIPGTGRTPASPAAFTAGSLRLLIDTNLDGAASTTADEVLASGGNFVGRTVSFTGINKTLTRGSRLYMHLSGDLTGAETNVWIKTQVAAGGAVFKAASDNLAVVPTGLPQVSASRQAHSTAPRMNVSFMEDFETDTSILRPRLEWERVTNGARSRSGLSYLTASTEDTFIHGAKYAAVSQPAWDMSTISGNKRLTGWVRYSIPNAEHEVTLSVSTNGGANFTDLSNLTGSGNRWTFIDKTLTGGQATNTALQMALFVEPDSAGSIMPEAYFDFDRLIVQDIGPTMTVSNFIPRGGVDRTLNPGESLMPMGFELKNNSTTVTERIDLVGFRFQDAQGNNLNNLVTVSNLSVPASILPNTLATCQADWTFSPTLVGQVVYCDLYVNYTSMSTNRGYVEDSSKAPVAVSLISVETFNLLQFLMGQQGGNPATFDYNSDGVVDSSDVIEDTTGR